ncbi:MmgE/PrpD family protein [Anaerotruncus sp. AF02-27]|uniref:MmgE/PrpD family protein n=1 Tax=Anaerotruncus TaxID=244127 RepID=UPI000E527206|nr:MULTISPECIES: MmgE/PrpD family protein [Anaerotruncus]RGX56716.1 MmgE/PrpD family protein [Anaerotruncus sp. AF02-27]
MHFSFHEIKTDYTQKLAEYIHHLRYEDLPAEVTDRAKKIIMQTIGVALAAPEVPLAKAAISVGKQYNGPGGGDATVWIDGSKLSMVNAAFVNGTLSDLLDWEDCSWTGHPSAGAVPVAWAVAEGQKKSGKDLITAVVAAYEVYQRIAMVVDDPDDSNGWGLTSWQMFACVVPACKLLGLDPDQINQALGFGTACSPITASLCHTTMSDAYHYLHGFRARDGVALTLAAKGGVENFMDCFDDPAAYEVHMTANSHPEWYLKDLGERYLIMETLLKHWPANMWNQTPMELAHKITTENGIQPDDIAEIVIDPPTQLRMAFSPDGYSSLTHAQFSIPFCIAAMLCDPRPGAHWYSRENMKNPRVLSLASKVKGGPSKEHSLVGSFDIMKEGTFPKKTLTITTKDGKVYSDSMDCLPGHPKKMLSWEELSDRYRIQAGVSLPDEKVEEGVRILQALEEVPDVSAISHILHR